MQARQIKKFQKEILDWYILNKRDLPWRHTRDPYKILVSEMMLQQTQVSRVIPKYEAWLKKFPTVECLANAKKQDTLRLWSGLGYNRRALYLSQIAKIVVSHTSFNSYSLWPQTIEELEKLPGIGPYTARAIACFAFNQQVAVVDANVRKVILLKCSNKRQETSGKQKEIGNKELQEIADHLLPKGSAYDWNQALMDYSNLVLQKEKVPTKKQKSFRNSNRYYRGKLLRLLLGQKFLSVSEIGYVLRDDYSEKNKSWKENILSGMKKDGLLRIKDGKVSI